MEFSLLVNANGIKETLSPNPKTPVQCLSAIRPVIVACPSIISRISVSSVLDLDLQNPAEAVSSFFPFLPSLYALPR